MMKKWMKEHASLVRIILAIVVVTCCFLVNTGGAWLGDRANVWELLMTVFYICFWSVFTVSAEKYGQLTKIVFVYSLLTFISSVCALIFSFVGGFIIEAALGALVSVPFYGFRFFMGWTGVYVVAVVVSTVWVVYAGWNLILNKKNCE